VTQMINLYIDGKRLAARVAALSGPTPARPVALSVSVDLVQTLFNWEWAFAEHPDGVDRWSWWARDIRLDPAEVIASDGEGGTWRVPFITDGQSTITFQAPERVREDYVPSEPPEAVSAFALHGADRPPTKTGNRLMAAARAEGAISYLRRTLNASPTPAASRPPTNQEGSTVTPEELRESLGLAADATDEQVRARLTELNANAETEPEAETPEELETPVAETEPEAETPAPEPIAASMRSALGLPSTATDDQVRQRITELDAGARAGSEARAAQLSAERDQLVDDAVRDGRIPPSTRDSWRAALEARPTEEAAALAALTPDRIPVSERGATPTTDNANPDSLKRVLAFSGLSGRQEKN
jgi:hypothetical protein